MRGMRLIQQGGQVLHYVRTPRPTRKIVIAALAADFSLPTVTVAAPAEVMKAKKIFSAPMPGAVLDAAAAVAAVPPAVEIIARAVIGKSVPVAMIAKAPVTKKSKVAKESAPVMADVATPAPVPVAKERVAEKKISWSFSSFRGGGGDSRNRDGRPGPLL